MVEIYALLLLLDTVENRPSHSREQEALSLGSTSFTRLVFRILRRRRRGGGRRGRAAAARGAAGWRRGGRWTAPLGAPLAARAATAGTARTV
jgi:hypothetical protein